MKKAYLKELGITNYEFYDAKPYYQYINVESLKRCFEIVNSIIKENTLNFFKELKANLDLKTKSSIYDKEYSSYYLKNYFGLTPIPDLTKILNLTKNIYDSDLKIEYDTNLLYDDFLNQKINGVLSGDEWSQIASAYLNYDYPNMSIPYIFHFLKCFFEASQNEETLDYKNISFSKVGEKIKFVITAKTDLATQRWRLFKELYDSDINNTYLKLPSNRILDFEIVSVSQNTNQNIP